MMLPPLVTGVPWLLTCVLLTLLLTSYCEQSNIDKVTQTLRNKANDVSDTLSSVLSGVTNKLGPDLEQKEQCSREGCDSTYKQQNKDDDEHDEVNKYELTEVDDDPGVLSQLYDITSSSVATVYRTAQKNVFDKGAKMVKDFSDKVREIVHEELFTFLQTTTRSLANAFLTPGATLYYLGQTAMTVSLILICLLLTYLLMFRVSLLFIAGSNATVFLLHQWFGPQWIFDIIIWMGSYFSGFMWFMLKHYYISSALLVVLFAYSIVIPLIRWCTQRTQKEQIQDVEISILDISRRLRVLEEKQDTILDILRRLDAKD